MKKILAAIGAALSSLAVFAAATVTDANGTLTISVPSGEEYNLSTHASGIAANTWTEIVKEGPGTLNGAGSFTSTAFTGTLRIREGWYYAAQRDALPNNESAKVVVEGDSTGGGTLKTFNSTANDNLWDKKARLFLSGTGVGGTAGALHNVGTKSAGYRWVQLDADALLHSEIKDGQFQFRDHFDMQGHDATFTGQGEATFFVKITNPGDLYGNGRVIRFNASQVHGLNGAGRHHRIYVRGGYVSAYNTNNTVTDWEICGDHPSGHGLVSVLDCSSNTSNNKTNRWTGSISLEAGAVTNTISGGNQAHWLRLCEQGSIGGPGTAFYQKQLFIHGTNTYAGSTIVDNGATAHFVDERSIPNHDGYGDVFVYNGGMAYFTARTVANPEGWKAPAWIGLLKRLSLYYGDTRSYFLEVPAGRTAELDSGELAYIENTPGVPHYYRMGVAGGGTAKATLTFMDRPWFLVRATNETTTLEIATPNAAGGNPGQIVVQGKSRLVFKDAGLLSCTTNIQVYGDAANGGEPRLVVAANSRIVRPVANKCAGIELGMAGNGRPNGTLEILSGGIVSNRLQSANANDGTGTLLVRSGGTFYQMGTSGEDTYSAQGHRSEAYYELEDGATMTARGTGIYTSGGSSGITLFNVKGGLWDHSGGTLSVGRESTGMVYQTGGTIRMGTQFAAFPSANYRRANNMSKSGFGSLTLEGAGTEFVSSTRVGLCDRGYSRGQIDVNDGATLTALKISKSLVQYWKSNNSSHQYERPTQTIAYVGFNCGVLRAAGNAIDWLGDPSETYQYGDTGLTESAVGDSRPDYVTVYAGGATLDASNFNVTVQAPLVRPGTGKSVTALAIPANADMTGYTAAPIVQIFGDGQGALAMALYDSTNGVVTGVKVVSPGWGYTTATAQLIRGGKSTATALEVTLAEADRTGGLTVTGGTGTVTLAAANTYGGPTTTAGGTLKVAHANAIPDGSEILLGDGVLDMNGFAIPSGCTVKIADPSAYVSRSNTVTVACNLTAPVTVANVNEMPPNWYVDQSGGNLYLIFSRGTCIIFR